MINMIKMEMFRLFKTKSLYVILAIMAAITVFFTYMVKDTLNQMNEAETTQAEQNSGAGYSEFADGFEAGVQENGETDSREADARSSALVTVEPSTIEDASIDDVTLLTMLYDSASGMMLGLFLVIFAVLFATADTTCGFIKNIGGQVSSRNILILSKAFGLLVYTVVLFASYIVVQGISTQIFFGYIKPGDAGELASYLALQILLHFALALFCMMLALLIKNNVVTIIIVVLLCADIPALLFRIINQLIGKLGIENFDISKYSLTNTISVLETSAAKSEVVSAVCIGICFAAFAVLLSCFIFKKRDIA